MPSRIDVIVVTYDSAPTLSRALLSVAASPLVGKTIVVDNASTDGSAAAARGAGASAVVENAANLGFAAAVNRGLHECDGDYVLLLNPDAAIEPPALALLAAALDTAPAAALAAPALEGEDGRLTPGARRFSTVVNRLFWHLPLPRRPQWATPDYVDAAQMLALREPLPVDYLWGATLLVRRRFLADIGGLDERFFLYSEDEDLGRQARARGLSSLLVPRARARHQGGGSTPDPALALARVIGANALLLEKWDGRLTASLYRRAIGPVLTLRAALLDADGRWTEAELAARTRRMLRTEATVHAGRPGSPAPRPLVSPGGSADQALGYLAGTARLCGRALVVAGHGRGSRRGPAGPWRTEATARRPQPAEGAPAPASAPSPDPRHAAAGGEPTVSVILPVYNAASSSPSYLSAALRSVAAQSPAPLELVVVDDGSTDETTAVVEAFGREHPGLSIRVVHQSNGGQSSARNHGARESRGDWLAFLDQDDEWTPDHLATVMPRLGERVDLVYTDADTIDEDGRLRDVGIHRNGGRGGGHPCVSPDAEMFQDLFVMPGVMTIRREFFEAVGRFDEQLSGYEDDDLFLRCLQRGRLAYVPVSTLRWRIHPASASHTERMTTSGLRYWRKLVETYAASEPQGLVARRLTLRFVRVFLSYASAQLVAGNPLFAQNLAAAESLLPHLGAVDRTAFALTRWAWRSPTFAGRCGRSWYLDGLRKATG